MVEGLVATALVGMAGGLVLEAIHVAGALKADSAPTRRQLLGSIILIALGAGVLVYGTDSRPPLEVMTMGAAFPALFTGAVRALEPRDEGPPRKQLGRSAGGRSELLQWLAWRP